MNRTLLGFLFSLLAAHALRAGTTPVPTGPAPVPAPREAMVIYYDHTESAITFSARELQKTLRALGHNPATLKPLAELPASPEPCYVVLAKNSSLPVLTLLGSRGGQSSGALREQAYALRNTRNNGKRGYWVIGGDRIGAMYGGIHLGEIAAAGAITDLADGDHRPYIAQRGIKFNIPLDKRQPSFDDNGTSGLENFQHVWDLAFWKEYIDTIAKQRYNVLSLWNRHPFPTLVKVPGYEAVDYMWWVEGCRGNLLDKSIQGFHTVGIFLDKRWGGMDGTKHIGLHEYVIEGKTAGITPLASADQLDALAREALKGAAEITDGGNAELRETLGDIRTQARLGQYYAAKIRGAVSVGLFRKTGEARHQTEAVAHLEKALTAWHAYVKELDAHYTNKLYLAGQKTFDWFDDSGPRADIEIARKGNP